MKVGGKETEGVDCRCDMSGNVVQRPVVEVKNLALTLKLPKQDQNRHKSKYLFIELDTVMGGREAQDLPRPSSSMIIKESLVEDYSLG